MCNRGRAEGENGSLRNILCQNDKTVELGK